MLQNTIQGGPKSEPLPSNINKSRVNLPPELVFEPHLNVKEAHGIKYSIRHVILTSSFTVIEAAI